MPSRASKPVANDAPRARRARSPVAIASGLNLALKGIAESELTPRVRDTIARLYAESEDVRRELEEARARITSLERLADEDSLAPIANRRAFVRELSRMIAFSRRYGVPSSVVYFDVNGMKQINDTHGHPAGDAALRHVAEVLCANVRSSDIVGRLGGDEFGVILAQTNQEQAKAKGAALAQAIAASAVTWGGITIPVSAACGVYSFSDTDDAQVAIEAADRAMYQQKREMP
jgi:diguanylate cyclase (GGDEF)-like protein